MLEKIKEFYSTKRTPKVVITVLVMVLLVGGVTCTALFLPTSASNADNKVTDKLKSVREKLNETAKGIGDKTKADEETAKADEETAKQEEAKAEASANTSETPSASSAKSGSSTNSGSTSSGASAGNTSGKHEHNYVAKKIWHDAVEPQGHTDVTPAITQDIVYIVYDDGCKGPASDTTGQQMHDTVHPGHTFTTVTETEILKNAIYTYVEDVPFKPGYNETIYTCSCGATK